MIELADHQVKAISQLKNGSILCGGVGSGKSRAALAYYYIYVCNGSINGPMRKKVDLYIITTAKKRDSLEWDDECKNVGIENYIVDSWNNISKYTDVKNSFFIFDEQRVVGYGAWTKSFLKISRMNYWILLSATPGDTWIDYLPVFIANKFYKNKKEFVIKHVVYNRYTTFPKIDRYIGIDELVDHRKDILVLMPHQKKTTRHQHWITTQYDEELYLKTSTKRFNFAENKPFKTKSELCQGLRKICNASTDRIDKLKTLVKESGRSIIFYNYDYELELLRKALNELKVKYAEWNGHKHEPVPTTKQWAYLVQYNGGAEGWNCITTDTIIFYSLNYSYRMTEQSCGRIDRMNTKYSDLHYYYLYSTSSIDKAIIKALQNKGKFNESAWVDQNDKIRQKSYSR